MHSSIFLTSYSFQRVCVVAADDNTAAAVGGGIAALAVLITLILIIGAFVFVKYKRRVQKKQPMLGRYHAWRFVGISYEHLLGLCLFL